MFRMSFDLTRAPLALQATTLATRSCLFKVGKCNKVTVNAHLDRLFQMNLLRCAALVQARPGYSLHIT